VSHDGRTDISFTVPREDFADAMKAMEEVAARIGAAECTGDDDVARVSLVGAGMKAHPGVSADMFGVLAEAGVNIEMISTSAIRISIIIRRADVSKAVRAVHEHFKLSEEVVLRAEHPEPDGA
jgi:aspartate kinase